MPDLVHCDLHGETPRTFVCVHLKDDSYGLGFNRKEPSDENPYPDAWCDACEVMSSGYGGWDTTPEELQRIALLCSECYERARIRNTRPSVSLDDLASLRWKCGTCDEWHSGPCLDFGFSEPYYWTDECEKTVRSSGLAPDLMRRADGTFLDSDYCSIDGQNFFVRGLIHLPILGASESFCWGVWGSLSRENFELLLKVESDPNPIELKPMFSWLSSKIPVYEDTLSLKMYARVQGRDSRPHFWIERSDHPLSVEFHRGITPERLKELMITLLPAVES
jgi:hypothetical protein